MLKRNYVLLAVVLFCASVAHSQQNDFAVTFGVTVSPSVKGQPVCEVILVCPASSGIPVDNQFSAGFVYSRRLANFKAASLHLELPLTYAFPREVHTTAFHPQFSSLFLTPGLKMKLFPEAGISPFVVAGGGLAHFSENSHWSERKAFEFGGGVDIKTPLRSLGIRMELRDFIAGRPGTTSFETVTSNHLQSISVGGGFTLHD